MGTISKPLPTQEYLLDCFEHIGPHLIWLERPIDHFDTWGRMEWWNFRYAGWVAGKINKSDGYVEISIHKIKYKAHRIIYKIHTGVEPIQIDHINRIRHDNRFENLRSVTHLQNCKNRSISKKNISGHTGITPIDNGWRVQDYINEKTIHVGHYKTLEEAIQAKKEWDNA